MARYQAVMGPGTLYGVGVGPGDTELLTLKAARLLSEVRIIAYPAPNGGESLARRIVAPVIPETARELPISIPMVQNREAARQAYDRAVEQMSSHLSLGEHVLFLCEGDPFFYGSFMFIHERLSPRFPCVVVPGVTSLTACAAAIGRPLAARNDVLRIIPATLPKERIRAELKQADAAAIIKVGRHFDKVRALLEELGLAQSSAVVEHATQGDQRIFGIDDVPDGERPYFSTILVYGGGEPWR
jgi:precorrin-2/cobalt-factor-2 C20-methyltransferase